jgi:hypothetical protein
MANLLRPVVELQNYKVLGVVGKNMLVREASLTDGALFIKVLFSYLQLEKVIKLD